MRHRQPAEAQTRSFGQRDWLFAAALLTIVVAAYQPAWNGGFIWDDNAHVTRSDLRSLQGLWRIWFELGATQQYYPLVHSAFWAGHRLWGDTPLGYHLVSILLHAVAALMVALILRQLSIPGAYLAATLFALHPVHVESVAWMTELKNTLSGAFYLGSAMVYLRFQEARKTRLYLVALGLFVLGLLSKTVTGTLPAALLLICWWQRGRLSWRRDVVPLCPFFVLGVGAGLFTAFVERTFIGADGAPFDFTMVERCLIAGRAIWFYLATLLWPSNLVFVYPRWHISQDVWWQYLFPAAALALLGVLWLVRQRWRGPLAGMLFFVGTLFPVLGFFNVYPFLFSFVADHFQYLASLGVITLVSAGTAQLLERWRWWRRPVGQALCLALISTLAILTWRQSHLYADIETLYRTTISRNPDCWMAYNNLAGVLVARGAINEAIPLFQKALQIKPDYAEAHNNLGGVLSDRGRVDEGIAHLQMALEIKPAYAEAHNNLGLALARGGQVDEAIAHFHAALQNRPTYADAHNNLGVALARAGRVDEAMAHYQRALKIKPEHAEAHNNLAIVLNQRRRVDEAIAHFRKAVEILPTYAEAHNSLGVVLINRRQAEEAIAHFQKALEVRPEFAEAHNNLGIALAGGGRFEEAVAHLRRALEIKPAYTEADRNLGLVLARRGAVPH
ncbi:MAG TPA: tetratricopeptide repeat protein [Methylomirabilota bacterium]|jgi:tetratricopeptide (TPR) repeat protein|nr:tetratricopeptide repeat protein [Methylomirabilota bacterium]